jgi:hypothetical protein
MLSILAHHGLVLLKATPQESPFRRLKLPVELLIVTLPQTLDNSDCEVSDFWTSQQYMFMWRSSMK